MIRRRLHRRWYERCDNDGDAVMRSMRIVRPSWSSRLCDWDVRTHGEAKGSTPLWARPIMRAACSWEDWRHTLSLRKPMSIEEWKSLG